MSTNPAINPKWRSLDSNGNPLAGGKLYTYAAGTSTPLSTYTTRAGSVANANPVVLDANGEADVWMSPGVAYKFVLKNSADVTQWTVDNIPSAAEQDLTADVGTDPGGRLTLTTGTPVDANDVTGATTIFYSPYKNNKVPLYDGSGWSLYTVSSELSQATSDNTKSPAAVAASTCYDLFVWNDSGVLRLSRGPAWSNSGTGTSSRGTGAGTTELERKDGRWVNKVSISNGPAAQRGLYVGTVCSDASSQINDSLAKRHVWNTYNRVRKQMKLADSTTTWSYSTDTFRQARATATNQLDLVAGLTEDAAEIRVVSTAKNTASGNRCSVGIGLDSTTSSVANAVQHGAFAVAAIYVPTTASYAQALTPGRHIFVWLERASGGTTDWLGVDLTNGSFSAITGSFMV